MNRSISNTNRGRRNTRLRIEALESRVQPTSLVGVGGMAAAVTTNLAISTALHAQANVTPAIEANATAGASLSGTGAFLASLRSSTMARVNTNVAANAGVSAGRTNLHVDAAVLALVQSGAATDLAGHPSIGQALTILKYPSNVAVNSFR